ncbi:YbhB/YbcL family Raf kinase inhibitor-like protein [Streptacidiphilus fuscans]|uniref:YbhB/YbcL family Raf kinase inhibitor-like protein n=1 Tax=Streptacidiphilus fuscans TaxID=2789292 RepID=A0A931FF84_9ACTN|nr:YbhB/YbcL family Raf kinase inhibitor-like protein [Streptacidiphilus fuscans]MBF9071358.1 YbhB/YbcL family Raf kinase inhibitor-like protein [Streptacidiphilus fuscans]
MDTEQTRILAHPRPVRPFARAAVGIALIAAVTAGAAACGTGTTAAAAPGSSAAPVGLSSSQTSLRGPDPYAYLPKVPAFRLTSTTVRNGQPLPAAQLSKMFKVPGGQDISPQLTWSGFPKATKSFVVSMYDPQAPTGSGFWHWVVIDIPATTTSLLLDAGAPSSRTLPPGAVQLADDAGVHQYVGGAPPAGSGTHDYYITVTALDVSATGLPSTASPAYAGFAIGPHTLARATIVCPTRASGS